MCKRGQVAECIWKAGRGTELENSCGAESGPREGMIAERVGFRVKG
jgi:hypothetical protein